MCMYLEYLVVIVRAAYKYFCTFPGSTHLTRLVLPSPFRTLSPPPRTVIFPSDHVLQSVNAAMVSPSSGQPHRDGQPSALQQVSPAAMKARELILF